MCGLEKYRRRLLFSAGDKPYLALRLKKEDVQRAEAGRHRPHRQLEALPNTDHPPGGLTCLLELPWYFVAFFRVPTRKKRNSIAMSNKPKENRCYMNKKKLRNILLPIVVVAVIVACYVGYFQPQP